MKSDTKYQEGDLVSISGTVVSANKDGVVTVQLDTHFETPAQDFNDVDLKLVSRPLKKGDSVKYGTARKPKFGTYQEAAMGGVAAIILVAGGKPDNAKDLELVNAIDLQPATAAEVAQAAVPATDPA